MLAGKARPFGEKGEASAINKLPLDGPAAFDEHGLVADEQADLSVHGGVDKALHHYPFDYYERWLSYLEDTPLPAGIDLTVPGAFGENISVDGLIDSEVCLGDIFSLGSGVVQISQGRQPCWKLNHRFQNPLMVKLVMQSGMSGWYYRVLEPGVVAAGDRLVLKERLAPSWRLNRVTRLIFDKASALADMEAVVKLPYLSESWRQHLLKRLAHAADE